MLKINDAAASSQAPGPRIKCVKRKYYMMHQNDKKWYQYSRQEVDELAGNVVVDEKLYEAGSYAWKMRDRVKRGFPLRQGARKKRRWFMVFWLTTFG